MTVTATHITNRVLAIVLFRLLAGVQQILAQGRRTIDGPKYRSECLGHFLATRTI